MDKRRAENVGGTGDTSNMRSMTAPTPAENPPGWPYATDPVNSQRCGEAFVGYEGGEGSCEYLPNHPGRHWSARWGSWSL